MANTASVEYYIEGDEKELEKIYNLFDGLYNGTIKARENTSPNWAGNVCFELGDSLSNYGDMRCYIEWYELEKGDYLHFMTQEAWGVTDFINMLKNNFPSIKPYYFCEESGCEVYESNDFDRKYFGQDYVLDYEIDGECGTELYMSEEDILEYLSDTLEIENLDMDKLDEWNKEHNNEGLYAYIYPIVRVEYSI